MCATFKFQNFSEESVHLSCSHFPFKVEPRRGWISTIPDLLHRGKAYKVSDNSQQWDFTSCRDKLAPIAKKGGIYDLKGEAKMNLKIDAHTKRLDTINVSRPISAANTFTVKSCSICSSPMHLAQTCPSLPIFSENQTE